MQFENIKVLSWNVACTPDFLGCITKHSSSRKRRAAICVEIFEAVPDIIMLQEVFDPSAAGYIRDFFERRNYEVFESSPRGLQSTFSCSGGLLTAISRTLIRKKTRVVVGFEKFGAGAGEDRWAEKGFLTVVFSHARHIADVCVVNTHLQANTRLGCCASPDFAEIREAQTAQIMRGIKPFTINQNTRVCFLAGDFNIVRGEAEYAVLTAAAAAAGFRFEFPTSGVHATTDWKRAVDYIFAILPYTEATTSVYEEIAPSDNSDHHKIIVGI